MELSTRERMEQLDRDLRLKAHNASFTKDGLKVLRECEVEQERRLQAEVERREKEYAESHPVTVWREWTPPQMEPYGNYLNPCF